MNIQKPAVVATSKAWIFTVGFAFLVNVAGLFYWGGQQSHTTDELKRLIDYHTELIAEIHTKVDDLENLRPPSIRDQIGLIKKNQRQVERLNMFMAETKPALKNLLTNTDGLAIWKEIGAIRTMISKLPTEVPPKWLLEKMSQDRQQTRSEINGLKNKVERMTDLLLDLQRMTKRSTSPSSGLVVPHSHNQSQEANTHEKKMLRVRSYKIKEYNMPEDDGYYDGF